MAVKKVREYYHLSTASFGTIRSATRVFGVTLSSKMTPVAVCGATDGVTSIPAMGTNTYPGATYLYVKKITPRSKDQATHLEWDVDVEYSDEPIVFDDPLSRPYDLTFTPGGYLEKKFLMAAVWNPTIGGTGGWDTPGPYTTSAGEAYEELQEVEIHELQVNLTRNETTYDPGAAQNYLGAVNNAAFNISLKQSSGPPIVYAVPAYSCRMGAISGSFQRENGIDFWRVNYPMKIRGTTDYIVEYGGVPLGSSHTTQTVPGWAIVVADRGSIEFASGSDVRPIFRGTADGAMQERKTNWALDGLGNAMPNASSPAATRIFWPEDNFRSFSTFLF